jgi:hypothetical protein
MDLALRRAARHPPHHAPTLRGALIGGSTASAMIVAVNQLAHRLGLTDYDLPEILGLSFGHPGQRRVKPAGLSWYLLSGGLLVPTSYWLGFRLLGRAGAAAGLGLGIAHYIASGLLLGLTNPDRPKRRRGEGRPMGAFLSRYGLLEQAANIAGHLVYGLCVGRAAAKELEGQMPR